MGFKTPGERRWSAKKKDQSCMRSDHKSVVETLMKYGLVKPQHKINKARLETPTLFLMACCLPSRLKVTDPDGNSIPPFVSTRPSLKYCGVLSSDITPTSDGHEKTNGWIPPASLNSREIRGARGNHLHSKRVESQSV
ncbi:hypothetical protein TNCV_1432131 [Trichonephila clavipes]|nr:hypothetical protein TNCV_1432131 [Trichonephila clavipes]